MMGKAFAGLILAIIVVLMVAAGSVVEDVGPDEIVAIQAPVSGNISWYTTPGLKPQWLGTVRRFKKRDIYAFQNKIRFNDGGHAVMNGSIQYEMPTDEDHLLAILVRFGSQEAVQEQLVKTVVDKATYMTGPLMSSKESYAEKRNSLIWYVEDQVRGGVYKTTQSDVREKDPITGIEKTMTVVKLVKDEQGTVMRQEEAVLAEFGIKPFNFAITDLPYDDAVEKQIQAQQKAVMEVQTSMAESKKSEQRALTVEQEGKAKAAEAKWEQEAIKAKAVTEAQQQKEVAEMAASKELEVQTLKAQTAEQYRIEQIRRAEADSTYKAKVMQADGALTQKLTAYKEVMGFWAQAFSQYRGNIVPSIQMAGGGAAGGNGAQDFMSLLSMKAAKDLSLDLALPAHD